MLLPSIPSSPEESGLPRFAGFLRERRERITALWMDSVRRNPKVGSADHLDSHALADHLPKLFDDLAGILRGDTSVDEVARDAESHGQHRWQQDYSLPEVTRELSIVCRLVLEHGLDAFEDAFSATSRAELRRARERILRFFEDTAAESVEEYTRRQRERVEALHEKLREADRALAAVARFERDQFCQLANAMPQIVWAGPADGQADYFNRRWYEYTGAPSESVGDEVWGNILHPDDLRRVNDGWTASVASGQPYESEFRLKRASDGAYRWFLGRALPIKDAGSQVLRWIGTGTDIHDFKHLQEQNEQLLNSERAARTAAERTSRIKDEFLSTLSHELRTPLNAIYGWAQLLRGGAMDAGEMQEALATIERNAQAQKQIIDDLLDMSRIISGKVRLDAQRIDLTPVLQAALETVRLAAEAKGIRIQATLDAATRRVSGDPVRLQQVFWNLLSNAIKFTPAGGQVQVSLREVNSQLEVSVSDSGEGIAAEFLPHVFDRFSQADASPSRRHGGLGLGLAIVKQLVELHGGTVHVQSAGPGLGATFRLLLPLAVVHPAADPAESTRPGFQSEPALLSMATKHLNLPGVKVLVVDDEHDSRTLVKHLLEAHQAKVRTAGSAAQAMELIRLERFDVVVSDIGMPGEDGYALIRRIRALPAEQGGSTPAIALTAFARSEDRHKAIIAGYAMHVSKPVKVVELLTLVASLTGPITTLL